MRKLDKAFLEITDICNLQCSFCHGTKRAARMLTAEEFEALTDRLAGRIKFLYFHLMGEPLLHPLFPQFVRRAWEKGFYPILTTNGSHLQKRGEELLADLPYKISISLHAPAANAAFADPAYFDTCIDFAKRAAAKGCITVLRLWNIGGEGRSITMEFYKSSTPPSPASGRPPTARACGFPATRCFWSGGSTSIGPI